MKKAVTKRMIAEGLEQLNLSFEEEEKALFWYMASKSKAKVNVRLYYDIGCILERIISESGETQQVMIAKVAPAVKRSVSLLLRALRCYKILRSEDVDDLKTTSLTWADIADLLSIRDEAIRLGVIQESKTRSRSEMYEKIQKILRAQRPLVRRERQQNAARRVPTIRLRQVVGFINETLSDSQIAERSEIHKSDLIQWRVANRTLHPRILDRMQWALQPFLPNEYKPFNFQEGVPMDRTLTPERLRAMAKCVARKHKGNWTTFTVAINYKNADYVKSKLAHGHGSQPNEERFKKIMHEIEPFLEDGAEATVILDPPANEPRPPQCAAEAGKKAAKAKPSGNGKARTADARETENMVVQLKSVFNRLFGLAVKLELPAGELHRLKTEVIGYGTEQFMQAAKILRQQRDSRRAVNKFRLTN